ncbi:restriction endonuclease subunit S [Shewanella sp. SR1]|uniref:restriction endonuclease subunit S n=1 Tax=Shewanella sp. SR1 TaxID=2855505 RepID=UPI001CF10215|nr:restriction endonuclease subunit S [Shewanella sp. SR1]MCB2384759.1 restriction endonuclease subunit S [Shewanella sp. SR1]
MSVEKNVPEIRFKGFSGEVSTKNLKEVVITNTYGPRFNANDYDCNGNVKTIRGTDISIDGRVLYNQVPLASLDVNFIKEHILEDGDLVMITTADCGLTGLFEKQTDKYICSAYAVKVTLDQELASPLYFKYFFQTTLAKTEINKFIRKATVANLPASAILQIAHKIPCKPEQTAIGNTFQKLDILINQHQQKHDKLSSIKKAMLEKMFPKQGETTPEIRFKGFSGEWEEKEFSSIATRVSTQQQSSCLPCVEYEDIVAGEGRLNKDIFQKTIFKAGLKFEVNDVLFGKLRPYLRNWLLADFNGIAVGDFWILRAETVANTFLFYLIQTNRFELISNLSAGSKMPRSDWGLVSKSSFYVPMDTSESQKIGNYFQKLDALINQHQQQITKLNHIKQACLSKMFV